jgi:hypothetical protein
MLNPEETSTRNPAARCSTRTGKTASRVHTHTHTHTQACAHTHTPSPTHTHNGKGRVVTRHNPTSHVTCVTQTWRTRTRSPISKNILEQILYLWAVTVVTQTWRRTIQRGGDRGEDRGEAVVPRQLFLKVLAICDFMYIKKNPCYSDFE